MDTAVETAMGESGSQDAAVREQLERVLASPQFRNSKRCQALLRFVTETAVENRPDDLREKIIGFRVFGRDVGYDTSHDAIVRNVAAEVRKRLAQYYLDEGHERELRIELPAGSYVPSVIPFAERPEPTTEEPLPREEPKRARVRRPLPVVAACIGVVILIAAGIGYHFVRESAFDRFWAPVFAGHETVQVLVGQPVRIYGFTGPRSSDLDALFTGANGPNARPASPRAAPQPLIRPDEIRWYGDRYIYLRDAFAMTRVAALLQAKGGRFRLMPDTETTYPELRGSPVIAIGAFNNKWAQRLGDGTRFSISRKVVDGVEYKCIADREEPSASKWVLRDASSQDYAIVTRVVDPSTERTVVLVAGIQESGTQAAGEFVTDPTYMNAALRNAPRGWENRNIQLVLQTKLIAGTPGPAKVVAMDVW